MLHDNSSESLLKLVLKPISGLDEPISLTSSRNLAVGGVSNKLYQWQTIYDVQSSQEEDSEE